MKIPFVIWPWQVADRIERWASWGSWAVVAWVLLSVVVPLPIEGVLVLLAVQIPLVAMVMVRQQRMFRQFDARLRRIQEAIERGESFDVLPGEDQEDLNIAAARKHLSHLKDQ